MLQIEYNEFIKKLLKRKWDVKFNLFLENIDYVTNYSRHILLPIVNSLLLLQIIDVNKSYNILFIKIIDFVTNKCSYFSVWW